MLVGLLHDVKRDQLEKIKKEMIELGTPTIRGIYIECHDMFMCLEGNHRVRAAKELGLTPNFVIVDFDLDLDVTTPELNLDLDMPGTTLQNLIDDAHHCFLINF